MPWPSAGARQGRCRRAAGSGVSRWRRPRARSRAGAAPVRSHAVLAKGHGERALAVEDDGGRTSAPVSIERFGVFSPGAGRRPRPSSESPCGWSAGNSRRPPASAPLKSSFLLMPRSLAGSGSRPRPARGCALSPTASGPPAPCQASAARLILGALEVGEDVVVAPPRIAELAPMVEVLLLAADVDQAVDRGRAAEHLAARPGDAAAVQARLGSVW